METFRLADQDKGQAVLPVGLQHACESASGADLVARPIGESWFVVESTDAVLDRIWSRVSDMEVDSAVDGLHEWRTETDQARRSRLEDPELNSEEESDRRARRLLSELGL